VELQKLIAWAGPLLYLAGALWFVAVSDKSQRKPVLLGWLVPGLGHWVIGQRARGIFFGAQIVGLFVVGLLLSDFRCVSPFDRHPIWALTQIPGGLLTIVTTLLTWPLKITRDVSTYQAGCLYVSVACLLNLVALCDLYDLTEPEKKKLKRKQAA
jgi:Family of unknown function (DUF6677)